MWLDKVLLMIAVPHQRHNGAGCWSPFASIVALFANDSTKLVIFFSAPSTIGNIMHRIWFIDCVVRCSVKWSMPLLATNGLRIATATFYEAKLVFKIRHKYTTRIKINKKWLYE